MTRACYQCGRSLAEGASCFKDGALTCAEVDSIYEKAFEHHEAGLFEESKEALSRLVALEYEPALCLLAVVLGDIDSLAYREDIIALCEKAH